MAYFDDIRDGIRTTVKGLTLTLAHIRQATKRRSSVGIASDTYFDLQNGLVTLQYPHEQLPIPDNGRYKLRNEIDDCIVCDKCAKVCPVDCITIDAIKATEEVGKASDGSPIRLYAATFDIDMAKCCYCGLCTVVCPTECLTMDKEFDYSEFDLGKLTYHFSDLTPQQADEKRALYEQFVQEKEAAKQAAKVPAAPAEAIVAKPRPAFRPTAKPASPPVEKTAGQPQPDATPDEMEQIAQGGLEAKKHPVFRPSQRPAAAPLRTDKPAGEKTESKRNEPPIGEPTAENTSTELTSPAEPKQPAAFRPTMKPPKSAEIKSSAPVDSGSSPAFRPTMKPPKPADIPPVELASTPDKLAVAPEKSVPGTSMPGNVKPAFRPTMKPAKPMSTGEEPDAETSQPAAPKPAFRPTMKPPRPPVASPAESATGAEPAAPASEESAPVAPKLAFRPTMKPAAKATPAEPETNRTGESRAEESRAEESRPEATRSETVGQSEPAPEPPADVKPAPKAFRPTMKPPKPNDTPPSVDNTSAGEATAEDAEPTEPPKAKPAFRPTMNPKPKDDAN